MSLSKDDIQPGKRRMKRNSIHSSPSNSSNTDGKRQQSMDIIEMFTIKTTKSSTSTTTELSDTVFIETTTPTTTIKLGRNINKKKYKNKINERFKEVRNQVSKTTKKLDQTNKTNENSENSGNQENFFHFHNNNETKIVENLTRFVYGKRINFDQEIVTNTRRKQQIDEEIVEKSIRLQNDGFYIVNKRNNPIISGSKRPNFQHFSTDNLIKYIKPTIDTIGDCNEILIIESNILQIQIDNLEFVHHSLFNREQVLGQFLRELREKYQQLRDNNFCEKLEKKLEILMHLQRTSSSNYGDNIEKLQELLLVESKNQRDLIRLILNVWKFIKHLRNVQQYSTTNYRLIIVKKYEKYDEEKRKFEERLEQFSQNSPDREQLLKRFNESFKQPGEPILDFKLMQTNEITTNINDKREIVRRSLIKNLKISLRIIANNTEICTIKPVRIDDNFSCSFNENLSIQFQQIPKEIHIEIVEISRFSRKILDKLTVKLPQQHIIDDNKSRICLKFDNYDKINYNKHNGIGSGMKLNQLLNDINLNNFNKLLNNSGVLNLSLYWSFARNPQNSPINSKNFNKLLINHIIDGNNCLNFENLKEWLNYKKPDPQDPKNSIFYQYTDINNDLINNINNNKQYCRLNPYIKEFEFCKLSIIEENIRFILLKLRDRNEPEFNHMIIPNNIKEIPLNILDDYKKRKNNDVFVDNNEDDDDIEKKLIKNRRELQRIYIKIFQNCKNYQNNLSYESIVNENCFLEEIIKRFLHNCMKWLKFNTNLLKNYEMLEIDKKHLQLEPICHEKKDGLIFIKIVTIENFDKEFNVFLEFELNNTIIKSSVKKIDANVWNEQLLLPLDNLHVDYLNPNSLNGTILINLYQEHQENHQKFLLGYSEVPLSIICFSKLVASIRIKTPRISFATFDELPTNDNNNNNNKEIILNLEIDINPRIPVLIPSIEELPCNEMPFIKDYTIKWNQNYNINHPERKFSIFAIDINGITTCITRYIKPIEPPPINNENFNVTEEQCVRFVTLIPFVYHNQFYQNVWLSTDQFLQLMVGSIVDHAVTLTCYLLALKKDVWLLLGFSNHYGSTGFVLIRNPNQHHQIYDVVTGRKYNLDDKYCPLNNVYCAINSNNIWANIQRNNPINLIRFDFNRKSDWLALFDDNIQSPTGLIQRKINYSPIIENIDDFEIILEQKIRKKFSKLRPLQRTIWNQTISSLFKRILNSFENMLLTHNLYNDIFKSIKFQLAPFQVRGQIWDLPFTSISTIVKWIKLFGLHQINDVKIEFISAISVKPYPNNVLSIWIFLGTVQPKPI